MGETEYSKTKSGPSLNLKVGIIPSALYVTIQVNCKYYKWSISVKNEKHLKDFGKEFEKPGKDWVGELKVWKKRRMRSSSPPKSHLRSHLKSPQMNLQRRSRSPLQRVDLGSEDIENFYGWAYWNIYTDSSIVAEETMYH